VAVGESQATWCSPLSFSAFHAELLRGRERERIKSGLKLLLIQDCPMHFLGLGIQNPIMHEYS
jgi:hypothetical protein